MTHRAPAHHLLTMAQTLGGGGVERAMLRLARAWIAGGRRVTLVLGSREGPLVGELPEGIDVIELHDSRQRALLHALPMVARGAAPDAIFCPGNHYSGVAAWTRLRLGRGCPPIVGKVSNALVRHDMRPSLAAAYRGWLRTHPAFLDAVVAMTPAMRDEAVAAMRIDTARVYVIPNPPAQPLVGAPPLALPSGRFLLGVGRLAPQKRWDRLIAALPRLADPTIPLVLLGEGSERAALAAQMAAFGVADRVHMPGHVADPLSAIARAALVVLTSDYEGVPGVLREAAALGTPVVSTDSSVAVREIVAPERGTIVPVDDPQALVAAIDAWLTPGRARPSPMPAVGDPAADYLALFDALASR